MIVFAASLPYNATKPISADGNDIVKESVKTNSAGSTIKCLRKAMGATQEEMVQKLGITYQAVSKWENDAAQPDIMMLPMLASYFGASIDELFDYKLNVMTNKERFIDFMAKNQILCKGNFTLKNSGVSNYYIDTEQFSTNTQISKIGEVFAGCIRENHLQFDTIVGLAYHGIGFSAATAVMKPKASCQRLGCWKKNMRQKSIPS